MNVYTLEWRPVIHRVNHSLIPLYSISSKSSSLLLIEKLRGLLQRKCTLFLKEVVQPKMTILSCMSCMGFFLLLNTKYDIFKNVGNKKAIDFISLNYGSFISLFYSSFSLN